MNYKRVEYLKDEFIDNLIDWSKPSENENANELYNMVHKFTQEIQLAVVCSASIMGKQNMLNFVDSLALSGYHVVVELDSYQMYLDEDKRHYSIEYVHPEYEGKRFSVDD